MNSEQQLAQYKAQRMAEMKAQADAGTRPEEPVYKNPYFNEEVEEKVDTSETEDEVENVENVENVETEEDNNEDNTSSKDNELSDSSDNEDDTKTEDKDDNSETETQSDTKKKSGFDKSLERKLKKISALERENAELKARVNGTAPPSVVIPDQIPVFNEPRPKFADYNDIDRHAEAVATWTEKKITAQLKAEAIHREVQTSWENRVNDYKKERPDFDEAIQELGQRYANIPADDLNIAIQRSSYGPQMYVYLADNTEVTDRIMKMPIGDPRRLVELGKIEAMFENKGQSTSKAKKVASKAPPPISSVKGKAAPHRNLEAYAKDSSLSQSDYREMRMKNRPRW